MALGCMKMALRDRRLLWLLPAALCALCGLFLVGVSIYATWNSAQALGEYRAEAGEGSIIALALTLPFWVLVSAFSYPARHAISRRAYFALNAPAVLFAAAFVIFNISIVVVAVLGKHAT